MKYVRFLVVVCFVSMVGAGFYSQSAAAGNQRLFEAFASTPAGQVPVLNWWQQCEHTSWDACLQQLEQWSSRRRLHPLTRDAIDYAAAQALRVLGRRDQAVARASRLGFIRTWTMETSSGPVVLTADPVNGIISTGDFLELLPGTTKEVHVLLRVVRPTTVALRAASTGLQRVCAGMVCVDVDKVRHPVFDGVSVLLPLKAGANDVTLAFSAELHALSFQARITAPNGKRLPNMEHQQSGEILLEGPRQGAGKLATASQALEAMAEAGEKKAGDATVLACILARVTGTQGWGDWADKVAKAKAGSLEEALFRRNCTMGADNAYQSVRDLVDRYPQEPQAWLAMAEYRCGANQRWQCWLALQKACPGGFDQCFEGAQQVRLVLLLQEVWAAAGFIASTQRLLEQALSQTEASAVSVALAETLSEQENLQSGTAALRRFLDLAPGDAKAAALQMYLLEKVGQLDELLKVVKRQASLYPSNTYFAQLLATLYDRLGETDKALGLYQQLEKRALHNPLLLTDVANYHYLHGRKEDAIRSWERILHLRPNDVTTRELLQYVSGAESEQPAGLSNEEVLELAEGVPEPEHAGIVGVADHTTVTLFSNRASSSFRFRAMRIVNPGQSRSYTIEFSYDSHLEDAEIVKALVLRSDGSVSRAADYGDRGMSEEEYNLYYDQRTMFIRFEELEPGDLVVVGYEIQRSPSALGTPFAGVHWLQGAYPRHNVRLDVVVPAPIQLYHYLSKGTSKFQFEQETDEAADSVRHGFSIDYVPPAEAEPFPPGRFDRLAYVHYSTMEDWKQFASWYAKLAYPLVRLDDEMRNVVDEIVEAGGTRRELLERLYRFVSDEIRYVGLELGVHGLKPYSPVDVFHRGFGDCKDKSLLLVSLLRHAGIRANIVVVATSPSGHPHTTPASHALFDHAIVHVPGEELFLDPTARYLTLDHLPWQDQDAQAIIIDAKEPRLVTLPGSASTDNRVEFTASVSKGDELQVEGTMRFTGLFAWRVYYHLENRASWSNTVESYVSSVLPVVKIDSVEDEVTTGPRPTIEVRFKGSWNPGANKRLALLKGLETNAGVVNLPRRELPMIYAYAYRQEYKVQFTGGTARVSASPDASADVPAAAFSVSGHTAADRAVVNVVFEQKVRRVETADYETYRKTVLKYQNALSGLEVDLEN